MPAFRDAPDASSEYVWRRAHHVSEQWPERERLARVIRRAASLRPQSGLRIHRTPRSKFFRPNAGLLRGRRVHRLAPVPALKEVRGQLLSGDVWIRPQGDREFIETFLIAASLEAQCGRHRSRRSQKPSVARSSCATTHLIGSPGRRLRTSPAITSVAEVVRLQSELSRVRLPQELISGPFLRRFASDAISRRRFDQLLRFPGNHFD